MTGKMLQTEEVHTLRNNNKNNKHNNNIRIITLFLIHMHFYLSYFLRFPDKPVFCFQYLI